MRMFKRILSVFLSLSIFVLSSVSVTAETATPFYVKMTSAYNVAPGQYTSFDVTVGDFSKLETSTGVSVVEIELPEVASFVSVEKDGKVLSASSGEYNLYNGNVVVFLIEYDRAVEEYSAAEWTWTINIKINSGAEMGYYSIGFYTEPNISDANENLMDLKINTGAIVIGVDEENLIGDTDGDGVILAADLVPMRKELLKFENLEFFPENADMNFDEKIDLKDLVMLKKNLVNSYISLNDTKVSDTPQYSFVGNGYIYQITESGEEVIAFAEKNEKDEYEYIDVLGGAGNFSFKNASKTDLITYNGISNYQETKTDAGTQLTVTYNVTKNDGSDAPVVTTYLFHENGINIKSTADLGTNCIASGNYNRNFLNKYIKTDKKINYNWVYPEDGDYPYHQYESIATISQFDNVHFLYTFNRDANSPTSHYIKNYPEKDFNIYGITDADEDGVISTSEALSGYTLDYDLVFVNKSTEPDPDGTAVFGSQQSDLSVRINLPADHDDNSSIFVGDKANLDVVVRNITDKSSNYDLSYNIINHYGEVVDEYSVTNADIEAGAVVSKPVEVSGKYGMYYLNLTFKCGDFSYVEYYPFAILSEHTFSDNIVWGINALHSDAVYHYALHSDAVYQENTSVSLCDKLGIDIVRETSSSVRLAKKLDSKNIRVYSQFGYDLESEDNVAKFVELYKKMAPYAEWFTFANEFDGGVKSLDIDDAEAVAKAQVTMDLFKVKYYNEKVIAAVKENNIPISWVPSCHANNVWLKLMNDEGIWADSNVIDTHLYSYPKHPDKKYNAQGENTMTGIEYGLERLKNAKKLYGGEGKRFVIGETGYPTVSTITDIRTQADFNTRIGILALAYGADIVNYYCMYDRTGYYTGTNDAWGEMHFGAFYNYDFYGITKPKPWAGAYGAMTRMLDGVQTAEISEKYDNYEEVYRMTSLLGNTRAFEFTMENGETLIAAWTNISPVKGSTSATAGSELDPILPWENQWKKNENVTFDATGDIVTVTDIMGNTTKYTVTNGKVTIPLTGSPVYIKGVY